MIDKKIVSKGEYATVQSKRASQGLVGTGLYILAVMCGMVTLFFIIVFLYVIKYFIQEKDTSSFMGCVTCFGLLLLFGTGTKLLRELALKVIKQAEEIDPGVPFTRANTADLPAPVSLVRASSEPLQEQQAVLLRAVIQEQKTPSEQLVQASMEQEFGGRQRM